jgi:hypothetical protein
MSFYVVQYKEMTLSEVANFLKVFHHKSGLSPVLEGDTWCRFHLRS